MNSLHRGIEELRKGSPSFVVTALIAGLAWWISHAVDRVSSAPTVEYRIEQIATYDSGSGAKPCRCVLVSAQNLSTQLFKNVRLELTVEHGKIESLVDFVGVNEMAPAIQNQSIGNGDLALTLPELQPRAAFKLVASYTSAGAVPSIFVQSSDSAVQLTKPSLATYFSRHEDWLVGLALLALAGFAAIVVTGRFFVPVILCALVALLVSLVELLL